MFCTNHETQNPVSYRHDLHALIQQWIAAVPDEAWQYFVAFRVGRGGCFVAKFMKQSVRGGPLVLVTFTVDHHTCTMATDDGLWVEHEPVRATVANIDMAVNYVP